MKKLIYLFSFTFLLLQSCSPSDNNESNTDSTNVVLVKKIVNSDGESNLSYDGTKLKKITLTGGEYVNITYSGDLITKMEWFSSNNISEQRNEYTYSSNKLTQSKLYSTNNKLEETSTLTYNSDGSITDLESTFNGGTLPTSTTTYKKYFDSVGNFIKQEQYNNNVLYGTIYYAYDTKNSPFKNITGWNYLTPSLGANSLPTNNLISEKDSTNGTSQITTKTINTYIYNSQDFPISKTSTTYGQTSTETYYY